jgi:hypothetical protein
MSRIRANEVKLYKNAIKNGASQVTITGEVVLNENSFSLEASNGTFNWNKAFFGIDTKKDGAIYVESFGGYSTAFDNKIYVHGVVEEDGKRKDDFQAKWEIAWEDRLTESLFEEIGDMCFITVGIEKDKEGKVFYKKFLSSYDAIAYMYSKLQSGMKVRVKADVEYSKYEGRAQRKKILKSIYLVDVQEENYGAEFEQVIYIDKTSTDFKPDMNTGEISIMAKVPQYINKPKVNGVKQPVRGNCLFPASFVMDTNNEKADKLAKLMFGAQDKEVWYMTVIGKITKAGSTVEVGADVLPDDIKELVEYGALTEQEALEQVIGKVSKSEKWVITTPKIKKSKEGKPIVDINKVANTTDILVCTYEHMLASVGVAEEVDDEVMDDITALLSGD